jgi:hypothetical protein
MFFDEAQQLLIQKKGAVIQLSKWDQPRFDRIANFRGFLSGLPPGERSSKQ